MRLRFTNVLTLLCLPALLPAVGAWLAPWHWTLDLMACFVAQATLALAATALVLATQRRWRLVALFATGATLAAIATFSPLADRAEPAPAGSPASVRVFCANLLHSNTSGAGPVADIVRQLSPDVLFFSEVTPAWLTDLRDHLGEYPFVCARAANGSFGVAMFARAPLLDATVLPLGVTWAPAIRATIATRAGDIEVLGVHTPRPGDRRHNAERDLALAALPGLLAQRPGRYVVLGDFNATPFNPSFRNMLAASGLRNASARNWLPTWPQQLPWPLRVPIDHVLVSPEFTVLQVQYTDAIGSDHAPLVADLVVQPHAAALPSSPTQAPRLR